VIDALMASDASPTESDDAKAEISVDKKEDISAAVQSSTTTRNESNNKRISHTATSSVVSTAAGTALSILTSVSTELIVILRDKDKAFTLFISVCLAVIFLMVLRLYAATSSFSYALMKEIQLLNQQILNLQNQLQSLQR
jgi:hypothetical protein